MKSFFGISLKPETRVGVISSMLTSLAVVISFWIILQTYILPNQMRINAITPQSSYVSLKEVEDLELEVKNIKKELDLLIKKPSSSRDISTLNARITILENRLTTIEMIILENPEKALEITLINKDIANLESSIETSRAEMERANSMYQFLLGTIALGVFSLAVTNFLPKTAKEKERNT